MGGLHDISRSSVVFWVFFSSSWTFPVNVSEVGTDHFLPILLYYPPLPLFSYCEYVMMKTTTINNAVTFCISFPMKRKIHAELQEAPGCSCCNISIDKDVWTIWKEAVCPPVWDEMGRNMHSSNIDAPQTYYLNFLKRAISKLKVWDL